MKNETAKTVVHFRGQWFQDGDTRCGKEGRSLSITPNYQAVTCKTCLKAMCSRR